MNKDIISYILTSIRNADINRKETVKIICTNFTENIVKILFKEGFIDNIRKHNKKKKKYIVITLRHRINRNKPILNLKQISRPGLRIYSNYKKIPKVLGGMGIVILSTSLGIITDREARSERIGGELLCFIW